MPQSTHRRLVAVALVVLLATVVLVAIRESSAANAYTAEGTQSDRCFGELAADRDVLESPTGDLTPASGATIELGAPVTFSGKSTDPLTFAVASTPALLHTPDIDGGSGALQTDGDYTFSSTRATANLGTIYWGVSFSTADLKECQGEPAQVITTEARALTVVPANAPSNPETKSSPPSTELKPPISPPAPSPVFQVTLSGLGRVNLADPKVSYIIHCTASCLGETYYRIVERRGHAKPLHVSKLDLSPEPVTISSKGGGAQRFVHRYSQGLTRALTAILRSRDTVEVQVRVDVTEASGAVASTQLTARLRA